MATTEFSDFAQALYPVIGTGYKPGEFTKALFIGIYLESDKDSPIEEILRNRTWEAYYYGQNDISVLAKKIADSLDTEQFAEMLALDLDTSMDMLCDSFRRYYPDISHENYALYIANRFRDIIKKAATTKRKSVKSKEKDLTPEDINIAELKEKYGVLLVSETHQCCPMDGCARQLFKEKNGHMQFIYDIAVIDLETDFNNPTNLIAMCPDCCFNYNFGRTLESVERMKEIKQELAEMAALNDLSIDEKVEAEVKAVIRKIPKLPKPENVDLNYDPVPVRQKIQNDNSLLYSKIQFQVNLYYPTVHSELQNMEIEGNDIFNNFCDQIRILYRKYKKNGNDQDEIYGALVKWLSDATNEPYSSCEVVISYFVQKCEVFDAITE